MSVLPDFEIGVYNAWIFIIPLIVYWFSGIKFLFSKRMPKSPPPQKRKDKILTMVLVVTMFFSFFYSVFVPFKLETIWFYIGLLVYLVGTFFVIISMINFATTPLDKPVTKGLYRFSRNPMFIGFFLVYLGVAVACISWVYLLMTVLFILIVIYMSPFEEEITLGHYGTTYEQYMKKTPKWIGLPKK